jgi:branched-chain amino acid transport system ATP-binding protein
MPPPDLLRLEKVTAGYGKVPVLHGIDLALARGETLAIVGANGAGKSTLLRAIMGEISLAEGCVRFAGRTLANLPTHRRARLGIGYAPEGRQLFPAMTVVENLALGAAREEAAERRARVSAMLEIFPKLRPLAATRCGLLSGGEQQMVAIARALMGRPSLLLLDEPSTGLAPRIVSELYASLRSLLGTGLAVLVAEQNARAALRFATRAVVFEDGRIVLAGCSRALMNDPRIIAAYIGAENCRWAGATL